MHVVQVNYETGLMAKLCGAFVCNNVMMPIAVGCVQSYLSQGKCGVV